MKEQSVVSSISLRLSHGVLRGTDASAHVPAAKYTGAHRGGRQLNKLNLSLSVTPPPPTSAFENNSWRAGAVRREQRPQQLAATQGGLPHTVLFQTCSSAAAPDEVGRGPEWPGHQTCKNNHKSASGKKSLVMPSPWWWQWTLCFTQKSTRIFHWWWHFKGCLVENLKMTSLRNRNGSTTWASIDIGRLTSDWRWLL